MGKSYYKMNFVEKRIFDLYCWILGIWAVIKTPNCGCFLLALIFNLFVGGWSVNFLLGLFGKNIPFWADGVIGLIVGEVSVPVAIVVWILKLFGVL